jgi:hypothetical protein
MGLWGVLEHHHLNSLLVSYLLAVKLNMKRPSLQATDHQIFHSIH